MGSYSVNILFDMNEQRKDGFNTDFTIINKEKEFKVFKVLIWYSIFNLIPYTVYYIMY